MKNKLSKSILISLVLVLFLTSLVFVAAQTLQRGNAGAGTSSLMNCLVEERCLQIDLVWSQIASKLGLNDYSGRPYLERVWDPSSNRWVDVNDAYEAYEAPEEEEVTEEVSGDVIERILREGSWSPSATDTISRERLDWQLVIDIYHYNPGLLSLFLAVAEWGIEGNIPPDLIDPAGRDWAGPSGSDDGKHLMSYTSAGAVGIAHYQSPQKREILNRFGVTVENENNVISMLRRREVQEYLIQNWLDNYWEDGAMENTNRDVERAIVNARIANTNPSYAEEVGLDQVEQQISNYASRFDEEDRVWTMRRALVVYRYIRDNNLRPSSVSGNSIAEVAFRELQKWQSEKQECDADMQDELLAYWSSCADNPGEKDCKDDPWSAAFTSYVMTQAGIDFPVSCGHSSYFTRIREGSDVCQAYPISQIDEIKVGDLLCNCRTEMRGRENDCQVDFEDVTSGQLSHCDIVIERNENQLILVGGNVNDNVDTKVKDITALGEHHFGFISCS